MHGAYAIPRVGYFYSRPCGRGDLRTPDSPAIWTEKFLLTPLREGRLGLRVPDRLLVALISTHAPAGGATRNLREMLCKELISTHAPAGGATYNRYSPRDEKHHFYSRPCGRGDKIWPGSKKPDDPFLLTPLREGRRRLCDGPDGAVPISTHAPAGGATARMSQARRRRGYFYSRPCGRGDLSTFQRMVCEMKISTHAPAGGATLSP